MVDIFTSSPLFDFRFVWIRVNYSWLIQHDARKEKRNLSDVWAVYLEKKGLFQLARKKNSLLEEIDERNQT